MGDRGNYRLADGDAALFLYTHWGGSELQSVVRFALGATRDRWDDAPAVLGAVIAAHRDDSGHGELAFEPPDGRENIITVDARRQTVILADGTEHAFADLCDDDDDDDDDDDEPDAWISVTRRATTMWFGFVDDGELEAGIRLALAEEHPVDALWDELACTHLSGVAPP